MSLRGAKRRANLDPVAGFASPTRLPRCARNDILDNRKAVRLDPASSQRSSLSDVQAAKPLSLRAKPGNLLAKGRIAGTGIATQLRSSQ
jgi:hypothetical protein